MSVARPRNRLVYFRVSEDEYQQYSQICESTGCRCLSDLARSAMQSIAQNGLNRKDPVNEKLATLEALVIGLNRKLHELTVSLGRPSSQEKPNTDEIPTGWNE